MTNHHGGLSRQGPGAPGTSLHRAPALSLCSHLREKQSAHQASRGRSAFHASPPTSQPCQQQCVAHTPKYPFTPGVPFLRSPAGHTTCPPSRLPTLVPCWGLGAETGSLSRAAGGAVGGGGVGPPLLHSTPLTQWPQMQPVVATPQTTVCAPTGGWHCLLPPGSWVAPVGPLIQTHTWSPLGGCRSPHGGAVPSQAESRCPVNRECRGPRAAAAAPWLHAPGKASRMPL